MKKTWAVLTAVFAVLIFCFIFAGCTSRYAQPEKLENADIIRVERTGLFGTDYAGAVIIPKATAEKPVKVKLEKTYHKTVDSWIAKCPEHLQNPKQRKNWKHEEVNEVFTEEVLSPRNSAPIIIGGSNSSTGNLVAPSAVMAGGIIGGAAVLRPDKISTGKGSGGSGGCDWDGCY